MKYEVTLSLTELGQQIVGKPVRVLAVDIVDETKIKQAVLSAFPMANLIASYTYTKLLSDLNIGDIVTIHNPNSTDIVIGEITDKFVGKAFSVQTRNKFGELTDIRFRFSITGTEIGPRSNNKKWIEPANDQQIAKYRMICDYAKMADEIRERVNYTVNDDYFNQDDPIDETENQHLDGKSVLTDLSAEQLQRILDIFNEVAHE